MKILMWNTNERNWNFDMGQVMKVRLSCYLILLSNDSKTKEQDRPIFVT